jgi:(1->4)-alpha-D-glucan 1-alpha-D-glucosylmutase
MTVPLSTVRLQFHRDFTFDHAAELVDYFAALGVSHVYASPLTVPQPGSTHGYDTVDPTRVNPELGGEDALRRLVDKLRAQRMGLIADIVPNHMGIGGAHNRWWLDILMWGRHSRYARHFDVDWHSPDPALRGKVLAPFLGASYGDELQAGRIALRVDDEQGTFYAAYHEHHFPICPTDYAAILAAPDRQDLRALAQQFEGVGTQPEDQRRARDACAALAAFARTADGRDALDFALQAYASDTPAGREHLHRLLERQHFRLAWWRTAADEVNWRRFFDISSLAGVRVERPEVFEAMHALIFRLYTQGLIDGVRIDHVDGLAEPREYCRRLHDRLAELAPQRPAAVREMTGDANAYLIVEKVLARGEPLRDDWPVDGTTGYDFMNDAGALLHDPRGEATLTAAWAELAGGSASFADEALAARRKVLGEQLSADLDRVTRALHRIARDHPATRDFTFASLRRVLTELVVRFPVYRIYAENGRRGALDERYFGAAREAARAALRAADHIVLERVDEWLGGPASEATSAAADNSAAGNGTPGRNAAQPQRRHALSVFSQLTSPLAAKAVEDTACYRYARLLSRNEVGADPDEFALSVDAFHQHNLERAKRFPDTLLATATHDHKRGEDARARLAVLSELADEWATTCRSWSKLNMPQRRVADGENDAHWAPGPVAEAMLYQTLVSCWPPALSPDDEPGVHAFAERVAQWQLKALREAKRDTDWSAPDLDYEAACRDFLFDILAPQRRDGFLSELAAFVARIDRAGALNSLQQTLLRLTAPGVPDLYQGTELWDFSLVDPDNRRPVDFALRRAWLFDERMISAPPSEQLRNWRDGRVKMALIRRALALRQHAPSLFTRGAYLPLTVDGPCAEHALAYARHHGDAYAIVVATRLSARLLANESDVPLVDPARWEDTAVIVPAPLASRPLFDWLSSGAPQSDGRRLYLRDALAELPVALLVDEAVPGAA